MENSRTQLLLRLFGFLLLLCNAAKAEFRENPTWNPNLTPFEQWRSAYFCLLNFKANTTCIPKYVLSMKGWLNVTKNEGPGFCSSKCVKETRNVLHCISHTKRDFWFANKATVNDINQTIIDGCGQKGFTGVSYHPVPKKH
ncbi:PREDICTED: uncharacterized protein LOC109164142 [Ipomoea nil]|uniref:uncharacterized protein LOC109164142 n=1 Tax=Ipomoea nil TaxID=35883 RepID=UPI00090176D5|nr:PREDICTED: uncharacterized protein LOC109164142 [Ipomoea nil]